MIDALTKTETFRREVLGVPVDFDVTQKTIGDVCTITVSAYMPHVEVMNGQLAIFAPPLKKAVLTEREIREMELAGWCDVRKAK